MKMRNTLLSSLAASLSLLGATRAAEPANAAQVRATLFQREVRAAFARSGWFAVEDQPGRLEVEHTLTPLTTAGHTVYAPGRTFAHLNLAFQPDTAIHTVTRTTVAKYIRGYRPGRLAYPPFVLRNPQVDQACQDALLQAEQQLAANYPDYAAVQKNPVAVDGKSIRLAVR